MISTLVTLNFQHKNVLRGAECKDDQVKATQQRAFLAEIQMAKPNSAILSWIVMKTKFYLQFFHAFNSFQSRPLPLKVFQAYFGLNLPIIVLKSGRFSIFCQVYDVFIII